MMRRALIVTGILLLAVLLAFPLRDAVHEVIVIPVAFLLWTLGLLYHALPQYIWWILVLLAVSYLFIKSLVPVRKPRERPAQTRKPPVGQVENLATWIHRSQRGTYNKWLVANRLGKLAHQILVQRDSGRPRSLFEPLDGPDWDASPELAEYIHSGLQGSFANYPRQKNPIAPPVKTPLDYDVAEAVEFLESKIDNLK
jgi:hypothetical protein